MGDLTELSCRISASEDGGGPTKHEKKRINAQIAVLKAELKAMLSRPLIARGVSTRYITSGSRPIADDILAGNGESRWFLLMTGKKRNGVHLGADLNPNFIVHETMLGLTRTDAGSDLVSVRRKRRVDTKQEQDVEEWVGIGS